jgi:type IV pilus assembly protein PilQ
MRVRDFRKLLITVVLVAVLTLAVQAASPTLDATVRDVAVNSLGQAVEARITASESARFTYFELDGPRRLVVDFHGLKNTIGFSEKNVKSAGVERIRTSYFSTPDRSATRIVFDLDKGVNYKVIDEGSGIVRVVFGDDTPVMPPLKAVPPAVSLLAGLQNISIEDATLLPQKIRLESLSPGLELALAAPTPPRQETPNPAATLGAVEQQLVAAPVVVVGQQPAQAPTPPPAPTPGTQVSPRIAIAPVQVAPAVTGPPETQNFNGEIIDLDLKQADIGDFFRLIGEISGLNVIVDQNVTGTVTVTLHDVPWDQALDIVLRNYNLGGILENRNVLRIATRATLLNEENQRRIAREALANSVPPVSHTFILSYAKAADAAATLLQSGVVSPRGRIAVEARRNAIIVTDLPDQFEGIEKMKAFIDVPSQQVEIEARLVAANKSYSREFGSQIAFLVGANAGNMLTGGTNRASPFDRNPPPRVTAGGGNALPLAVDLPAAATSGVAFLLQPGADILLDAIITAAEARGTARLLSQPKVMTENNRPAQIEQGTKIPVQTNVNNTITTTFLTFSLKLDVVPQITEDGTILMNVDVENSQPDFARTVNGVPSISTQHARTQTWVPDGNTMMIGGIFVDTDSLNVRQVPGLGSIPLIGHLFKNTQTIKSQAELFFFITPRIKKPDAVATTTPRN